MHGRQLPQPHQSFPCFVSNVSCQWCLTPSPINHMHLLLCWLFERKRHLTQSQIRGRTCNLSGSSMRRIAAQAPAARILPRVHVHAHRGRHGRTHRGNSPIPKLHPIATLLQRLNHIHLHLRPPLIRLPLLLLQSHLRRHGETPAYRPGRLGPSLLAQLF